MESKYCLVLFVVVSFALILHSNGDGNVNDGKDSNDLQELIEAIHAMDQSFASVVEQAVEKGIGAALPGVVEQAVGKAVEEAMEEAINSILILNGNHILPPVQLIGATGAKGFEGVTLDMNPKTVTVAENQQANLTVTLVCSKHCGNIKLIFIQAEILNKYLGSISPSKQNMSFDGLETYTSILTVDARLLGATTIDITIRYETNSGVIDENYYEAKVPLSVQRIRTIIDILFDYAMKLSLIMSTAVFGCELDVKIMKHYIKNPLGPLIGIACQYCIMPGIAFSAKYIFNIPQYIDYGLLAYASCPGGGASNIYTSLLGGEINLSITMTFLSTIASLGFMPLWMYTAGAHLANGAEAQIPFTDILTGLSMVIVPVFFGLALGRWAPKVALWFVKILKPISITAVLFLTGSGFYINFYILEKMAEEGWNVAVPSVCLPLVGICLAMLIAKMFKMSWSRVKTVGIETGVQNMPLAITLLRTSLPSPASQLSAIGPVAAGLATPVPIILAILARVYYYRCYKGKEPSTESMEECKDANDLDDDDYSDNYSEEGEPGPPPGTMRRMSSVVIGQIRRISHIEKQIKIGEDIIKNPALMGTANKRNSVSGFSKRGSNVSGLSKRGSKVDLPPSYEKSKVIDRSISVTADTMMSGSKPVNSDETRRKSYEVGEMYNRKYQQNDKISTDHLTNIGLYSSEPRTSLSHRSVSFAPIGRGSLACQGIVEEESEGEEIILPAQTVILDEANASYVTKEPIRSIYTSNKDDYMGIATPDLVTCTSYRQYGSPSAGQNNQAFR